MSESPKFDLDTPDGGRGYIAHLFKTVLKRHDYRQYIAERLAGDFACTMAQHLERITAERDALQQRLNEADQRIDELTTLLREGLEEYKNGDDWIDRVIAALKSAACAKSQTERAHQIPGTSDPRHIRHAPEHAGQPGRMTISEASSEEQFDSYFALPVRINISEML